VPFITPGRDKCHGVEGLLGLGGNGLNNEKTADFQVEGS
jgi:hypothetical protein